MDLFILKEFFEAPVKEYSIRELSRVLNKNHMTIRSKLLKLVEEDYLKKQKTNLYDVFKPTLNLKFLNLKLFYNLEKLRKSKLVEKLNEEYDYPQIILFGSYCEAKDYGDSDVDICLITNIKKEINLKPFEKVLNRNIDLRIFSESSWQRLIKENPQLVNNIIRGLVLSDEFEVLS